MPPALASVPLRTEAPLLASDMMVHSILSAPLHCNVLEALTRETLANEIHGNSKLRWDHMSGSLLTKIIVYVFFLLYFSTSSILYP